MHRLLLVLCSLAAACWAATIQPPPLIQTLSAGGNIGPEFKFEQSATPQQQEDALYWRRVGLQQLEKVINICKRADDTSYRRKAKNIIIFIGDGMGMSTITAGRIYKGQYLNHGHGEEEKLVFDEFPNTGLAKTYNVDMQVPDSAGTATAIFTGVKTYCGGIGMDITRSKANATQGRLDSIMDWAQREGKRTGVVTNTRITHATPAATYARSYFRDWECDTKLPDDLKDTHHDIARQLVEQAPGNKLNVVFGGGRSPMGVLNEAETQTLKFEGGIENVCTRGDQRNLAEEWLHLQQNDTAKAGKQRQRVLVHTREDLLKLDLKNVDHVMGLFRNNHITYAIGRQEEEPTLQEMTEAAIAVLERGKQSDGYVLLVESGRIDQAHHQNFARSALHEVYELDLAVQAALKLTNADETLIIVTADHSHSVTFNGYPKRGADILGPTNEHQDIVYETITYANGPGYFDHLANDTHLANGSSVWMPYKLFSQEQLQSPTYRHLAAVPLASESHGGEDVIVFANGPGANLVRGVFEQNYLAYVMSYAGCMGPAKSFDNSCGKQLMLYAADAQSGSVALEATLVRPLVITTLLLYLLAFTH